MEWITTDNIKKVEVTIMEIKLKNWRQEELGLDEIIEKYPEVPKIIILKVELHRRGYILSDAAQKLLDPNIHHAKSRGLFRDQDETVPMGLEFRDGTSIVGNCMAGADVVLRDPLLLDVRDGKLVITDQGKVYEEAEFWRKPDYYEKTTSKGTPMWKVLNARSQRLDATLNRYCHFWDTPGEGCKYCAMGAVGASDKKKGLSPFLDLDDLYESLEEALKQKGRFTQFHTTNGSILGGKELLDDEVQLYIDTFQKIAPLFKTHKIRSQVTTTALSRKQLERLRDEAGIPYYTADIEVLNKELFNWICPGKAKHIGYDNWKQRLFDAVEVFGRGNVSSNIVSGVETAQPNGFKTEEEALKSTLAEAEEFAKHGVVIVNGIWQVGQNTIFKNQVSPSLDYYVHLTRDLNQIREAYGIDIYFDDYRRCGNHPATDLARI